MALIDIYRGNSITANAEIDNSTVFSAQVNGEDKITATFKSSTPLNLMIKDYIIHKGLKYQILKFIDLDIDHEFTYGAVLMGSSYSLFGKPFLNDAGLSTFTLSGTATALLTILVGRINSVDSGWTVGDVEDDGRILEVQFISDTCRSALGRIFNAFGLEVSYVIKEISLTKRYELVNDAIPLAYGQNNGLYSLSKRVEGDFFTRVRGFGSTRNIPANYRGGMERLSFSPGYVDIPDAARYGDPIEIEVVFEDEYPHRTGTLSSASVPTSELQQIADTSIDFNLADNFIIGETPKIVMASGHWTGSEFEIIANSYNDTTKSFRIRPNKEGGFTYPSVVLPLQAGDTYTFIGINLPNTYVLSAEGRVLGLTTNYANTQSELEVSYGLVIDPIHVIDENLVPVLNIGQKIHITNVPTGINANMRITSITYPLIEPWKVTATISDKVQYSEEQQIQRIVIESVKQSQVIKENIAEVKAFTSRRLDENQAMVFDPTGKFKPGNFAQESISTLNLQVGSRTQIFTLSGILFRQNYLGNPNVFNWVGGTLAHQTVVPGSTVIWNIPSGNISGLVSSTAYYVYARCNRGNSNGVIVLDTVARQIESDSTYYYFLIGNLNSVDGDVRGFNPNYGITEVNGKFIKGTLTSEDGLSYIDLNAGVVAGKLYFLKSDESGYKDINSLNAEAADALSKATSAKAKTDILKSLAYEDIVEIAKLGTTVIEGGFIKTTLLDAAYIRSNIINADYIETLEINAVRGTIGGNEIASNGILGEKFSIIDGVLEAIDANFENINVDGLTAVDATITGSFKTGTSGVRAEMNSVEIAFYDSSGSSVRMSSGLVDYIGDNIGCGIEVGRTTLSNSGVTGASFSLFPNGVRVGNIGGSNIIMTNAGFSINDGSYITKNASFIVGGVNYYFVNGLLVNL